MAKRKWCYLLLIALTLSVKVRSQEDNTMYAHYINVGQGAAVLLEFPCGAMLIDAGASDDSYQRKLIAYLHDFFKRRKDLNNTISLVMVTHPHIDHNKALADIAAEFRLERYIDDGLEVGSGRANQKWMQGQTKTAHISYETHSFEEITSGGNRGGLTDSVIDPINCQNGDPKIILYSGAFDKQPEGWSATDFSNYNNHSLVVKVLFGKASFLFTGDLEKKGLKKLVETYGKTKALDIDVLMVGHHGADNATTKDYLDMVTPTYAVISCGEWNDGKGGSNQFTTWYYGHPRISTITMLEQFIPSNRAGAPYKVKAAEGAKDFRFMNVDKRIYATAWDQTITIRATTLGQYRVTTNE
jgi:competence protein ComEC